jgi:hypothetical protein
MACGCVWGVRTPCVIPPVAIEGRAVLCARAWSNVPRHVVGGTECLHPVHCPVRDKHHVAGRLHAAQVGNPRYVQIGKVRPPRAPRRIGAVPGGRGPAPSVLSPTHTKGLRANVRLSHAHANAFPFPSFSLRCEMSHTGCRGRPSAPSGTQARRTTRTGRAPH